MRRAFALLGALVFASALAACSSSKSSGSDATTVAPITTPAPSLADPEPYPAPKNPMALAAKAGLVPEDAEQLQYHVHAHLDVFVNGQRVIVPAGLGINIHDPAVHSFPNVAGATAYGGINPPCAQPCISPLHTHDVSGVLHTESATHKDNTLGQLFVEWNVKLDASCVDKYCAPTTMIATYVNGRPYTGDPSKIALSNLKEIAIVIGTPPARIPSVGDFSSI
jgi:hypothetical protein